MEKTLVLLFIVKCFCVHDDGKLLENAAMQPVLSFFFYIFFFFYLKQNLSNMFCCSVLLPNEQREYAENKEIIYLMTDFLIRERENEMRYREENFLKAFSSGAKKHF
jgi:hypothetical protein